jgi:predicted XRE-type DNA-binding protein
MSATIKESSGNVFADLGFEPAEASILEMRAKLMSDLLEMLITLAARVGRKVTLELAA